MRRCQSQVPNPTSQISRSGGVFHLSHASRMFAMFAVFPMFPMFVVFAMFPMFAMFAVFPRTRGAQKETERQEMRNSDPNVVSEARASARAYQPKRHSQFGIWNSNSRLKPGLKTHWRFKCFKRFKCFISFTRFKRYRNIWPLQKMKHPDPNIGTRVPDLKCAYFLKSKTILAKAFTPTSSRLSSMMKSGVWCGAASFGSLPAGIPPTVK